MYTYTYKYIVAINNEQVGETQKYSCYTLLWIYVCVFTLFDTMKDVQWVWYQIQDILGLLQALRLMVMWL